jgi:predicted RNA binding protein YcfA (HicA-like mRNA interferase family)
MTGKELLKIAYKNGFKLDRVTGSHHIVVKGSLTVSIPIHGSKDIPIGTANKILRALGER